MKLEKYIFTTKMNNNRGYLYIQNSVYKDKGTKTKSYCIGNLSNINEIMTKLMKTSETLFLGEAILFELFNKLGMNQKLSNDMKSIGMDQSQLKILQYLIPSRILHPFSKSKLTRYIDHSFMKFTHQIDHVNDIYATMKQIKNNESYFQEHVNFMTRKLNYDYDLNYFDTTNIYFYSNKDDLRTFAYSKDGKRGLPHIAIALACTEDRIPLYYRVYPGNTADITCYKDYIKTKPDKRKILVFDAGCYSFELILLLESDEYNYKYICGADISAYKYETDTEKIKINEQEWEIREAKYKDHRVIEAFNIEHHNQRISKIEENVARIKEFAQTVTGESIISKRDKIYDLVASLGLKTQIKVETCEDEVELKIDEKKINELKEKAKKVILLTNLDLDNSSILKKYLGRVEVEKAFWYIKNPLSIRPVYHEKEVNIKSHVLIVLLGYLQLTILRLYVSKTYKIDLTMDKIIEDLLYSACTAIEPKKDIFMTYMGKQVDWIKRLIIDLNMPLITETIERSVTSKKKS